MIENNKRGITINKALARTMLVSVAGLTWWGGGTWASLQSAADRLTSALTETREMIVAERASSRSWRLGCGFWKTARPGKMCALTCYRCRLTS